jgi:serine/threonine protein kinase
VSPQDPFNLGGRVLDGKYRLDRVIGEGGFGVVYAGRQLALDQPVAIKVLKPQKAGADVASFMREAKVLFQLSHPGIVRLYDVGNVHTHLGESPYVVLEHLAGRTLDEEIERRGRERRPFTTEELVRLADGLLEALAFAHQRGVVHRDIKPANVMIVDGPAGLVPKILDFGLARGDVTTMHTSAGVALTPRYAAPEQWSATYGAVGTRTDLFALGLVLEEAATLAPALEGETIPDVVASSTSPTRRSRVAERRPDLPPVFAEIVARATRVSPEERFPSADTMRDALRSQGPGRVSGYGAPPLPELGVPVPSPSGPLLPPAVGRIEALGAPPPVASRPLSLSQPSPARMSDPGPARMSDPGPARMSDPGAAPPPRGPFAPPPHPVPVGPPSAVAHAFAPAASAAHVYDAARGKGSNGSAIGGIVLVVGVLAFVVLAVLLVVVAVALRALAHVDPIADPASDAGDPSAPKVADPPPASASVAPPTPPASGAVAPPVAPSVAPPVAPPPQPPASIRKPYGFRVVKMTHVAPREAEVRAAVGQMAQRLAPCFEGPGRTGVPWNVTFTKAGFSLSGITRDGATVHATTEPGPAGQLRDCTDSALAVAPFPFPPAQTSPDGGKLTPSVVFVLGRE